MTGIARPLLAALALLVPAAAGAQVLLGRAITLEGDGYPQEAAVLYAALLRQQPGDAGALLGLERTGAQVGWRDSSLAYAARALAVDSANATAWGVELRGLRAEGDDSAAAAVLRRWAAVLPTSEDPYREWARYSLRVKRAADARDAVTLARRRLRRPTVLAAEMGQADGLLGDWAAAAAEWRAAVAGDALLADGAGYSLQGAPAAAREDVVKALAAPGDGAPAGREVASSLMLGWGQAERAWDLLRDGLPAAGPARTDVLRRFAEHAGELDGAPAQRAAAAAYDALAASLPAGEAVDARLSSARAYAAAGDDADAIRVLRTLADAAADSATRAAALGAMVELDVQGAHPAAAARLLAADSAAFTGSQRAVLTREVARGWLRAGLPDSAARAVAADGSLDADEIRGWVAVYRGALAEGRRLLAEAGAETGDPRGAARRAATVSLLDAVGSDSLPALGVALLEAERGDSLAAARALAAVARGLPDSGEARPAVLAWAARCAAAGADAAGADSLWREIAQGFPGSAVAPEAELAVARDLENRGDYRGAAARLEAMILAHPTSALVPEARRELDRVRGLVPAS